MSADQTQTRLAYRVYSRDEFLERAGTLTELEFVRTTCSDDIGRTPSGRTQSRRKPSWLRARKRPIRAVLGHPLRERPTRLSNSSSTSARYAVPIALVAGTAGFMGLVLTTTIRPVSAVRRAAIAKSSSQVSMPARSEADIRGQLRMSTARTRYVSRPLGHEIVHKPSSRGLRHVRRGLRATAGQPPDMPHAVQSTVPEHATVQDPLRSRRESTGETSDVPVGSDFGFER